MSRDPIKQVVRKKWTRRDLMKAAPLVEHLDLLEDLEIIRELDRVAPTAES